MEVISFQFSMVVLVFAQRFMYIFMLFLLWNNYNVVLKDHCLNISLLIQKVYCYEVNFLFILYSSFFPLLHFFFFLNTYFWHRVAEILERQH